MYSIAISTVVALLLLWLCDDVAGVAFPPGLPSLPTDVVVLALDAGGGGRSADISCRAWLMRFRRPCSAILCDVRLLVRFSDSVSGYETPGRCVPSRIF